MSNFGLSRTPATRLFVDKPHACYPFGRAELAFYCSFTASRTPATRLFLALTGSRRAFLHFDFRGFFGTVGPLMAAGPHACYPFMAAGPHACYPFMAVCPYDWPTEGPRGLIPAGQ